MSEQAGRYVLKVPISADAGMPGRPRLADGHVITEVVVRPAVAGDLRRMDGQAGAISKVVVLVAQLTDLSVSAVERLAREDFVAIAGMIGVPTGLPS